MYTTQQSPSLHLSKYKLYSSTVCCSVRVTLLMTISPICQSPSNSAEITNHPPYTACVNKSASLKEHFFLRKLYVSFVKVYNNMIGNIIFSFFRIFVVCNLDLWFRNYGKSCKVPPNLFGLIHWYCCIHLAYSPLVKINYSEQHNSFLTKVTVIIHVLIQFYMSYFDIR